MNKKFKIGDILFRENITFPRGNEIKIISANYLHDEFLIKYLDIGETTWLSGEYLQETFLLKELNEKSHPLTNIFK